MPVVAATRNWGGTISNDWATAGNWRPAFIPNTSDTAIIGNSHVVLATGTTAAVNHLSLTTAASLSLSGASGNLTVTGSTVVGTTGTSELNVSGGASLEANVRLGDPRSGHGTLTLSGTGDGGARSSFIGRLEFGRSGELRITGGAMASPENTVSLGSFPGVVSKVGISGTDEKGQRSSWTSMMGVVVGNGGYGELNISAGGYAFSAQTEIGNLFDSEGKVTVAGRAGNGIATELVTEGIFTIGNSGKGELEISEGAKVTSTSAVIGHSYYGSGSVVVSGGDALDASKWTVKTSLFIGHNEFLTAGNGSLTIRSGAVVESLWGVIGRTNSVVNVDGTTSPESRSSWRSEQGIEVNGELNITNGGLVTSLGGLASNGAKLTVSGVSEHGVPASLESTGPFYGANSSISVLAGGRITAERLSNLDGRTIVSGTMYGKRSEILLESSAEFRRDRSLEVSAGGLLKAGQLYLSTDEASTDVEAFTGVVTGTDSSNQRSEIKVTDLRIGAMGPARTAGLLVSDGALLTTRTLTMENGSRVSVTGGGEKLKSTLLVKREVDMASGSISIREGGYVQVGSLAMGTFTGGSKLGVSGLSADGMEQSTLQSPGILTMTGFTGDKVEINIEPSGIVDVARLRLEGGSEKTVHVSGIGWDIGLLRTGGIEVAPDTTGSTTVILDGGRISFSQSGEMFRGFKDGDIRLEGVGGDFFTELTTNQINVGLQGTGDFRKAGGGMLDLKAASTYSGKTLVYEGTLLVNNTKGSATGTGDVIVHAGGTLGGSGFISGNVFNSGHVTPGNSPGTLHIGGDFNQFGYLVMEIGQGGASDLLLVGGKAKLDGILELVSDGPVVFGEKHTLIQAEKGIEGTFQDMTFSNGLDARARLIVEGGTLSVRVAPKFYSQLATSPNERALAGVLDTWITSDSGDTRTVAENLDQLSAEEYRGVFNMLSPSLFAAGLATSIEQSQGQMTALNQHLNSRRLRPAMPNDVENPWEAWAISTGSYSPGSMSSLRGEDYSAGNFIAGIERQVIPGITAGLFNSYGDSEGDFAGSSEIEEERFTLGTHATAQYGGTYANTALGFGILEMDVKRSVVFGNLSRKARSSTDGTEFFAMLSGGHDFRHGSWIFGPSAALQYSKVRYDDVKENGAGALDMTVSNPEDDSLRSQLGGRVAYLHKANERLTLIPEARVFWQHEFLRDSETLDATMEQGLGLDFQHQVSDSDGDSVFTGVGLGFQTDFGFYGNVSYDLEFGREGDVNQTLSVGADWKF